MKPIFERTLPASGILPGAISWYAVFAAWLSVAALTVVLARRDLHLAALTRVSDGAVSTSNISGEAWNLRSASTPIAPGDFVSRLPTAIDPDATIRFTSRLAQDQSVRISQMQSQSVATDTKHLGQAKFTLQLRGDYPDVKNVVIGLLAKFPGLTLQHLTLRHRDAAPGNPADKGSDEATLELIQFIRPAALS